MPTRTTKAGVDVSTDYTCDDPVTCRSLISHREGQTAWIIGEGIDHTCMTWMDDEGRGSTYGAQRLINAPT